MRMGGETEFSFAATHLLLLLKKGWTETLVADWT